MASVGSRVATVGVFVFLGCTGNEHLGDLGVARQAQTSQEAKTMSPHEVRGLHREGKPGLFHGPKVLPDRCPNDKPKRADWADVVRTKADAKKRTNSAEAKSPAIPVPSAEHLERQRRFLELAASQQVRADPLSQEEREKAYANLKQNFFGE